MLIRAIPTLYNGVLFRSRLEADWARYFTEHRIEWVYESEGFDLDGTWYLPDFWLPKLRTFVEVKGVLDEAGEDKVRRLAAAVAPRGLLVVLAVAPAGEKWAPVTAAGPLVYSYGLETCGACRVRQFMAPGGCRICPPELARPYHDPPYSDEEWRQIYEWWADRLERDGKHAAADEVRRHVEDVL